MTPSTPIQTATHTKTSRRTSIEENEIPDLVLLADGPFRYPIRASLLFTLGFAVSVAADLLLHADEGSITQWLPPVCGGAAVLVGTLFPLFDYWTLNAPSPPDWSNALRCFGGFISIMYAATKLNTVGDLHLVFTLLLMSLVLWFLFDRTVHGLGASTLIAFLGTVAVYFLVSNGFYSFSRADFFGMKSWIPGLLFSGCICFATIGRMLEIIPRQLYNKRWVRMRKRSFKH
ncbi:uncharacterized protein VTP21DRAFT_1424 [Calcarisporiella thermophila]|uniref:uncharacterized protein n=1 Tax=Calcarisporiella thermophila TaxID=911321 RepID=UPI0037444946